MLANNREYVRGRGVPAETMERRNERIIARYQAGVTGQALADEFGITRERVCQILRRVNIIEHVAERRRLAREALSEEAERLKQQAKDRAQARIAPALELVRNGQSIRSAAMDVGLDHYEQALIAKACKVHGIKIKHGRHRDFSDRIARCEALAATGLSIPDIVQELRSNGDPHIYTAWVYRHFPHLRQPIGRPASKPPSGSAVVRATPAPPINPDAQWTDEKVRLLCKHWLTGCSAQQCVDLFGGEFTRNAIIGKVNRLRAAGQLVPPKEGEQ